LEWQNYAVWREKRKDERVLMSDKRRERERGE
jgi:hypothetical protein